MKGATSFKLKRIVHDNNDPCSICIGEAKSGYYCEVKTPGKVHFELCCKSCYNEHTTEKND